MTALTHGDPGDHPDSRADVAQWRDKKRYLWLMGLIVPTALFVAMPMVWALNQWGWHAAAQVPFWIGPILLYMVLPALEQARDAGLSWRAVQRRVQSGRSRRGARGVYFVDDRPFADAARTGRRCGDMVPAPLRAA